MCTDATYTSLTCIAAMCANVMLVGNGVSNNSRIRHDSRHHLD